MKSLETTLKLVVVALVVGAALALALAGWAAVNRAADYKELTAPRSLHQLALEARPGADDADGRGGTLLLGAGLAALALAFVAVVAFGLPAGREFGRAAGRRRKRARRPPAGAIPPGAALPAMCVLPPAPRAPALLPTNAEEGRYEDLR